MKPLLFYLIFVNIVAAVVCVADKLYAKKGWRRRVSEKRLLIISILGGAPAMYITMQLIRHKTQHKRFMITLPILILVQAAFLLYVLHIAA